MRPPAFATIIFSLTILSLGGLSWYFLRSSPSLSRLRGEPRSGQSFLASLTADEFDWSASTTPIPVSTASVWLKLLLSGGSGAPPSLVENIEPGDTVQIAPVRRWLNTQRFDKIIATLCRPDNAGFRCDVNEQDPMYGLTPMHVAAASGDDQLAEWLKEQGADMDAMDKAARKPQNLTFANFISNSKRWARQAGRVHCDLPEVVFDDSNTQRIEHAIKESQRLAFEGEPFLMRGALKYFAPQFLNAWNVRNFIQQHGHINVQVGPVPYASYFNISSASMPLKQYYDDHVMSSREHPLYVFQQNSNANKEGYNILLQIIRKLFPIPALFEDPENSGGIDGIHFFLGRPGSGAPMHIHADAVNALVHGSKRWFVYTPAKSIYSRKPIKQWLDEDFPALTDSEKPLTCTQRAGDLVYVPLDWSHAVINDEENTFGYALELLNKRDTYAFLHSRTIAMRDEL